MVIAFTQEAETQFGVGLLPSTQGAPKPVFVPVLPDCRSSQKSFTAPYFADPVAATVTAVPSVSFSSSHLLV